ncbi:hypothetical protein EI94DRAFT_306118 [Lactarius quietus]|nr:hypothetical protein EI94DRAFT_306118 [Lactarius quietus]
MTHYSLILPDPYMRHLSLEVVMLSAKCAIFCTRGLLTRSRCDGVSTSQGSLLVPNSTSEPTNTKFTYLYKCERENDPRSLGFWRPAGFLDPYFFSWLHSYRWLHAPTPRACLPPTYGAVQSCPRANVPCRKEQHPLFNVCRLPRTLTLHSVMEFFAISSFFSLPSFGTFFPFLP